MSCTRNKSQVLALAVACAMGGASVALGQDGRPYLYSVASGNPSNGMTFSSPVINNAGGIAFDATKYLVGTAILTGPNFDSDAFVSTASQNGPFSAGRSPQINDGGNIAFNGTVRGTNESGIFVDHDAAHNLMAGSGAIGYSATAINNDGKVIISASYGLYTRNPSRNHNAVFLGQAGTTGSVKIAENTFGNQAGRFRTLDSGSAVINNAGQTAFYATSWDEDAVGNRISGIYSGNDVSTKIIDTTGRFFDLGGAWLDQNDSGVLAFQASERADIFTNGVYRGRGEDAVLVAQENGTFVDINWVDINNNDQVIFNAHLDAEHGGFNGIFNGPDFEDRVIGPGDQIFGHTVRDAFFRRGGFNDSGDVAFYYITTESEWGVALATPAELGDSDANGLINFDDYANIDNGFLRGMTGWSNGDFDGNGVINFDDYVLIDRSYIAQGLGAPPAHPVSVPEPGLAGLLGTVFAAGARRRRSCCC